MDRRHQESQEMRRSRSQTRRGRYRQRHSRSRSQRPFVVLDSLWQSVGVVLLRDDRLSRHPRAGRAGRVWDLFGAGVGRQVRASERTQHRADGAILALRRYRLDLSVPAVVPGVTAPKPHLERSDWWGLLIHGAFPCPTNTNTPARVFKPICLSSTPWPFARRCRSSSTISWTI